MSKNPVNLPLPRLKDVERNIIAYAISRYPGHKPEIAESLGVCLKTLYNKISEHKLHKPQPVDDYQI